MNLRSLLYAKYLHEHTNNKEYTLVVIRLMLFLGGGGGLFVCFYVSYNFLLPLYVWVCVSSCFCDVIVYLLFLVCQPCR